MSDTVGKDRPGKAAIVGAGIGGLTATAALHRGGMDVEVNEPEAAVEFIDGRRELSGSCRSPRAAHRHVIF
ncbi:NAD(P)-binding protein [Streptomyces abikoensis]|uniref:NAD(P)-binding protein n=1 Tax=Streptomyces abikoensis TaxID=97398 RepID=UPI0033CBBB22